MNNKILYLTLIVLSINVMLFVGGCCLPGACCGNGGPAFFDVINMNVQNVSFSDNSNLVAGTTLANQSTVSFNELGISLTPEVEYFSMEKDQHFHFENPFITSAYACSPAPPTSSEMVDQIFVFSNADFVSANEIRPVGDTLNDFFRIRDPFLWENIGLSQYNAQATGKEVAEYDYLLGLNVAPDTAQLHQFTIHYYQTNGEFYTATTEMVEITP